MSQQNIDFGTFPDDPDADAIRTAFQKVQNNFNELYTTATAGSVTSVNQSAGAGIQVNSPTGNVIVTANIACVQVATTSLSIGQGSNGGTSAIISQTSQTLVIDINPANVFSNNFAANSTGGLANFTGTLTSTSNSQPNITSVGTLTNLAVTGNITASNVYANSGAVVATTVTGTLTTAAQPNITSLGTLTNLTVTGNSNLGNIATAISFSGDGGLLTNISVSAGNAILSGSSNVRVISSGGNVVTGVAGNANIIIATGTGVNVTGYLTASGDITSNNANLGNAANANYFIGNFYGTANSATTAGTVTTAAQPNITSVGTLTNASVTGNITAGNVYANSGIIGGLYLKGDGSNITNITIAAGSSIVNGNSNVFVNANSNVTTSVAGNANILVVTGTGVNVNGTLNATGSITGNFGGNVTNATQGNITSLGTLTGLTVNGLSNLGPVGNVTITGGSPNFFLMTNGSGVLTWTNAALSPVPGSNTQVIFNDASAYGANSNLTFNKTTGLLTATLLGGGLTTAAQPNITSVGTLTGLTLSGNLNSNANIVLNNVNANITTLGNISANYLTGTLITAAQPNITSIGTLTSLGVNGTVTAVNITANTGVFTGNGSGLTALNASNISTGTLAQARLANVSATINGTTVTLGGTATITSNTTQTLTLGSYLTGTSFNGGTAVTAAVDATTTNTASKVVARDASGNFSAGTITATLSGAATTAGTVTTAAQPNITSVGTLTGLTLSGTLTGAVQIGTGTATHFGTTLTTGANTTAGTVTGNWSLSAGSRLNATYADLAEKYVADADYHPGTVLVFGGEHEVTLSTSSDSFRVAGVVTTNPAYTMNNDCIGEHVTTIALQGRVPVKVIGPVYKGDLLVSCNNGHAIANNIARAGTIIGKSLENFTDASGVIEVAVGRF